MSSRRVLGVGSEPQTNPDTGAAIPGSDSNQLESFQCPICSEFMMSVGQMNRHLDDVHFKDDHERQDYKESQGKDVVTSWLRNARKHFQETPTLRTSGSQQSINDTVSKTLESFSIGKMISLASASDSSTPHTAAADHVTTRHWSESETCCHPKCSVNLSGIGGIRYGSNCRKCGNSFCDSHLSCQMRLSPAAGHDPDGGILHPVCETCFRNRKGFRDFAGKSRSRNLDFLQLRQVRMDKMHLESNLVYGRLLKLAEIHLSFRHQSHYGSNSNSSDDWLRNAEKWRKYRTIRDAEKSLVEWKDDSRVSTCIGCHVVFNRLMGIWKHHCRVCGDIICDSCLKPIELQQFHENQESRPRGRQRLYSSNSRGSRHDSLSSQKSSESLNYLLGSVHACETCFRLAILYHSPRFCDFYVL